MNTTHTARFWPGDLVQINPLYASKDQLGLVFEVTPSRGAKVHVKQVTDPAKTLTGDARGFIGIGHRAWVGTRDLDEIAATAVAVPDLKVGQVITMASRPGLWVVTGETNGSYRAYQLGGSTDGRYVRGINPATATVIPLTELASHLGGGTK